MKASTLPCHEYTYNLCLLGGGGKTGPAQSFPTQTSESINLVQKLGYLGGEKLGRPILSPADKIKHQPVTKWIKSCLLQCFGTFKMPILMFISILVFHPEGQIWNPVRRDTRIYVRRILNASRISKTQLKSCRISPS